MKKIILSAFLMLSLAACGTSKTADVPTGGGQQGTTAKVVTAKAILENITDTNYKAGELLVRFKDGTAQSAMDAVHQAAGATVLKNYPNVTNLQHVKLPAGLTVENAITQYMADSNVDYAEPNYLRTVTQVPNDRYFTPQQWAMQNTGTYANGTAGADIKATGAWDITMGSRRVAVGILDTGIDYTHPDLVGNMWADRVKVLLQDMHWLGHDTYKVVGEQVIYTDPYNIKRDSTYYPEDVADIILISHDHYDHCSPVDVAKIIGPNTIIVTTPDCAQRLNNDVPTLKAHAVLNIRTVAPGDKLRINGIAIEATPAYNVNKSQDFHPRGSNWVGFVFTVNRNRDIAPSTGTTNPVIDLAQEPGPRVYFAGDTDYIPEMLSNSAIQGADVAILPVSGTNVMTADEAVFAALHIRPKVAIPMHYASVVGSKADAVKFLNNLKGRVEAAIMVDHSSAYTAFTVETDNNEKIDDWRGWNFIADNNDPWDDIGHGTHVAGTIGATGNNGEGVAGVNWYVELLPLKVCGAGGCPSAAIIDAIGYATFKGVKILNASLGGYGHSYAERDAILAARQAGVLLIAAAGNGGGDGIGDNNDIFPVYPASYVLDNVLAVAATDQNDRRATFSNFGLQTVHVAAPGTYILSTVPTTSVTVPSPYSWQNVNCTGTPFVGYNFCAGTSMAAPHVTGVAALLYSVYGFGEHAYSYSKIRGMLIKYVDKQSTLDGWIYSGGRINAQRAVAALLLPKGLTATAQSSSEIALTWTDNSGEDKYVIERRQSDGSYLAIAETGQNITTYTDRGLTAGTSYTYRIKAVSSLPNPPNVDPIIAESDYAQVTAATPAQSGGSGGGGGCSLGRSQNMPTAVADSALLLLPLLALGLIRGLRRRK